MGCDIHLKLEKRRIGSLYYPVTKSTEEGLKTELVELAPFWLRESEWEPVAITNHHCWGDRVYGMFAKLADVRNFFFLNKIEPIPQRGFPEDACINTKLAYSYIVLPDEAYEKDKEHYENSDTNFIDETTANEWVKEGVSEEMTPFANTDYRKITGPDWHSPNWCTTKEMEESIREIFWDEERQVWTGDYVEWLALLGAMKGIEESGAYECRAVFWFDE